MQEQPAIELRLPTVILKTSHRAREVLYEAHQFTHRHSRWLDLVFSWSDKFAMMHTTQRRVALYNSTVQQQ